MKLSPFALLAASAVSLFALAGCSADAQDVESPDEEVGSVEDELAASRYVGSYEWDVTSDYTDFASLTLSAGGTYTAKVDASYVNPRTRCIVAPCTLPESGTWSSYKTGGKNKIRLAPSGPGNKPARIYTASVSSQTLALSLTRFGATTRLAKKATITCANVRCASGHHCEMKGLNGAPPVAVCLKNAPSAQPCVKTGCSGQLCADHDMFSTCEFRPEYACYHQATCERQADGKCGFTQTAALAACLASP